MAAFLVERVGTLNRISGVRHTFTSLGWANGLFYLLARVLNRISGSCSLYRYYLVAQPVSPKGRLTEKQGRGIQIREIPPGSHELSSMPRPSDIIRQRFDQGAVCLGAFKGNELAGFLWLRLGPYAEDEVRCRFVPLPEHKTAWDFDVYIDPKYRLGFTFARLWDEADRFLRANGIGWTLSRISAFNAQSLASHAKLGTKVLGVSTFICLGSLQVTIASVSPYLHVSLNPRSSPTLRLEAETGSSP